jgi:hypothetical protein
MGYRPIVHKVRTLKIGDIDLKDATLSETIEFLRQQSRIHDPIHQGINFVILGDQPELESIKVNASIKLATVADVPDRIPMIGFTIGDFVVGLRIESGDGLYVRTFDIPDNALAINPSMLVDKDKRTYDVSPLFEAKGVRFSPGASAIYSLRDRKLKVVSGDPEQIIRIDELMVYGFKYVK